jgi:hypothetical protein
MNNARQALAEMNETAAPQLQVVKTVNGIRKLEGRIASMIFPLSVHPRPLRAELAALGWSRRAARLAGK